MSMIVLLVILFIFILIGVPVGFAIGGATMIAIATTSNLNMVVNAQYCYSGIFSFTVMLFHGNGYPFLHAGRYHHVNRRNRQEDR